MNSCAGSSAAHPVRVASRPNLRFCRRSQRIPSTRTRTARPACTSPNAPTGSTRSASSTPSRCSSLEPAAETGSVACSSAARRRGPFEKNLYADIEAAWQVLRNKYGVTPENIILYGQSIGTVPTVDLASRYECAAVILHSPLTSGLRVAFPDTRKTYCFDAFPSIDKVSKVASPVLVIHGTDDEVINFSHGLAIYERCPRAVEPLWVEGAMTSSCMLNTLRDSSSSSPLSWLPPEGTAQRQGRVLGSSLSRAEERHEYMHLLKKKLDSFEVSLEAFSSLKGKCILLIFLFLFFYT
ncbi:uncharacterized protein LOC127449925 [Myxocyprinus asiaticus]|uniref:uncharacterized protein LOC127449925 n=1 Tax=Myxocyprinus asiaticus TaxID=70543 RepID=UPI002221C027|nr:uncharacterized protein LOC127449925 [Myxocyprinus asiaticus]